MYMERKVDSERDDILTKAGHENVRLDEVGQIEQRAMLFLETYSTYRIVK
jgi:hypothetical protein